LIFYDKLEPNRPKGRTLKVADESENYSIESMVKYENQSDKKFPKSACIDLGNVRSDPFELRERSGSGKIIVSPSCFKIIGFMGIQNCRNRQTHQSLTA
jgi:hypothetical protein